ncbi:MAG: 2,3-bisphosphoglycerate-independent phosphoglycerate mutase [Synechococcus sp.]
MADLPVSPAVLVILDGWGFRTSQDGNAIVNAKTPITDSLWDSYPHTLIATSGKRVGLPDGQMGNSEVGHLTIGAGRVVPQELVRISDEAEAGLLGKREPIAQLCKAVRQRGRKLHLVGLCSDGGVHSHINHLLALIDVVREWDLHPYVHAITDGRDTDPQSGVNYIGQLQEKLASCGGTLATISGRYYAMDRDRRWDRTEKMYRVMTEVDVATDARSAVELLEASYAKEEYDEFIEPTRLAEGIVEEGDGIICFNFRPDRSRQLIAAFALPEFAEFERPFIQSLDIVTMTQYEAGLPVEVAFAPQNLDNILGQTISEAGLKQLRIAETEKYAHVTYFFNGGIEQPFEGEDRVLIPSPAVSTYDRKPEMSAVEVTDKAIEAISRRDYSLVVLNYANPDMVGHTGNYEATVKAIETVDTCLGRLLSATITVGGTALILADHGNAELMWDNGGRPWTAHTTNPVPLMLVEGEGRKIEGRGNDVHLRENGSLADVAPTILEILNIAQPAEMTGQSLLMPADYTVRQNRTPVHLNL